MSIAELLPADPARLTPDVSPPPGAPVARGIAAVGGSLAALVAFQTTSAWSQRRTEAGIADFTFGNPHEMPMPDFVSALQQCSEPLNKYWFAYKMSEPDAQAVAATSLRERYNVPYEADDIAMTTGGFGAIATAMHMLLDPGDEVIFSLPPWFCYEPIILHAGGAPVKVRVLPETFDLDLAAIEAAITERTRMVIVNTPHNPTGVIYPAETLGALSELLERASARIGRTIYILSDEPYARIVFDGRQPISPAEFYPNTLIAYSYGKVLLTPGQRIGYLAISPWATAREELRSAALMVQIALGWAFPNALLQHAIGDLERMSIDVVHMERKRDRVVRALRSMGYDVHSPQGTFYLIPRSPMADDVRFTDLLAQEDVFVLPGTTFEMPGYFRISLTANDEMIERAMPGFAAAWDIAHAYNLVDSLSADGW
jgi:aspartate aminotransferase